jgi:PKD repeat protein
MASPHVAGALALLASANNPGDATDVTSLYNQVKGAGNFVWTDDSPDGITEPLLDVSNTTLFAPVLVAGSGGGGGPGNTPPTAAFTYSCTDLACDFDGAGSTDGDGSITDFAWSFGDGGTASGVSASHTFGGDGTFTVTLTVTDDEGATDDQPQSVTVSSGGGGGGITLAASGRKVRGVQHADLTWSGAASTSVDVLRNGAIVATTANDGAHTDNIGNKGGGSYTYQVCEAGTSTCSNVVTVTF